MEFITEMVSYWKNRAESPLIPNIELFLLFSSVAPAPLTPTEQNVCDDIWKMAINLLTLFTSRESMSLPLKSGNLMIIFFFQTTFHWNIVDLLTNVVLVSGVQQSDSYIYVCMYTHILFQVIFHYTLLQDIEYSSLCYTMGPYWLSSLYIVVCICYSETSILSLPPSPLVTVSLLSMSVCLFLFCK